MSHSEKIQKIYLRKPGLNSDRGLKTNRDWGNKPDWRNDLEPNVKRNSSDGWILSSTVVRNTIYILYTVRSALKACIQDPLNTYESHIGEYWYMFRIDMYFVIEVTKISFLGSTPNTQESHVDEYWYVFPIDMHPVFKFLKSLFGSSLFLQMPSTTQESHIDEC